MADAFCAVRSHLLINENLACKMRQHFNLKVVLLFFFFLFKEDFRATCLHADLNWSIYILYINGIYVFNLPEENNYEPLFHKRLRMAAHRWDNRQNYAKKKKKCNLFENWRYHHSFDLFLSHQRAGCIIIFSFSHSPLLCELPSWKYIHTSLLSVVFMISTELSQVESFYIHETKKKKLSIAPWACGGKWKRIT